MALTSQQLQALMAMPQAQQQAWLLQNFPNIGTPRPVYGGESMSVPTGYYQTGAFNQLEPLTGGGGFRGMLMSPFDQPGPGGQFGSYLGTFSPTGQLQNVQWQQQSRPTWLDQNGWIFPAAVAAFAAGANFLPGLGGAGGSMSGSGITATGGTTGLTATGGATGLTVPGGSTLGTMPLGTGTLGAATGLGGLTDLFNNPLVRQLGTQLLGGALGGGAGSTSAAGTAPTAQRIEQTSIPDYAKPYVEEMLGAARANVFNVDEQGNITGFQPYPRYQADRTAQFTPLQLQAFESAQALGPSAQVPSASHIAQQAGLAGMRAADTPYSAATFTPERVSSQIFPEPGTAQQYMSPYMQNVVDIQQREAQRQADIAGQRQQAEAVRAGAFGGGRDAIMRAEAARNLALQKGDIQAQGLQSAFQQAQAQFNADQARRMQAAMANQQMGLEAQRLGEQSRQYGGTFGLQGLETALRGAGTLGQLGQTQFGQEQAALQTQAGLGQQQQQQVQALLSQQYQDFLNQQRFPYQQLGFMSDMLRGLPMSQSATSLYQAPPNPLSQIAGLGMAAYGASNLGRAAGGPVHSSPAGLADLMVSQI